MSYGCTRGSPADGFQNAWEGRSGNYCAAFCSGLLLLILQKGETILRGDLADNLPDRSDLYVVRSLLTALVAIQFQDKDPLDELAYFAISELKNAAGTDDEKLLHAARDFLSVVALLSGEYVSSDRSFASSYHGKSFSTMNASPHEIASVVLRIIFPLLPEKLQSLGVRNIVDAFDVIARRTGDPADLATAAVKFFNHFAPSDGSDSPIGATWRIFPDQLAWSFWDNLYQCMTTERHIDRRLQRSVALIPDHVWQKGVDQIGERIQQIKTEWLATELPQAETIEFDTVSGQFETSPTDIPAEALIARTLSQVTFAFTIALNSNCGLNSQSVAALFINHTLYNCQIDPNAIEQNLEIALRNIQDGYLSNAYHPDERLSALEQVLERGITDLRAHHPEVAEAWSRPRQAQAALCTARFKTLDCQRNVEPYFAQ